MKSIEKAVKQSLLVLNPDFQSVRGQLVKGGDGKYYYVFDAGDLNRITGLQQTRYDRVPIIAKNGYYWFLLQHFQKSRPGRRRRKQKYKNEQPRNQLCCSFVDSGRFGGRSH